MTGSHRSIKYFFTIESQLLERQIIHLFALHRLSVTSLDDEIIAALEIFLEEFTMFVA